MTDNRPEPRTEAGRRMLRRRSYWSGNDDIRAAILAIEAEAASPAALDALIRFLDYEAPYWGDMPGQAQRWEAYVKLLSAARLSLSEGSGE